MRLKVVSPHPDLALLAPQEGRHLLSVGIVVVEVRVEIELRPDPQHARRVDQPLIGVGIGERLKLEQLG